ncbi:MAG: hypothetical protein HY940_09865 [Gammaproteobacteria bacterium]|nr:hypothetical protein [Gammaproteobacteria bacterium]
MKLKKLGLVGMMLGSLLVSGTSLARSDDADKGMDKDKADQWGDFRMMMTERHKMLRAVLEMQQETMRIVKDIDHHPSKADQDKLAKMITQLDEFIARDEEISKQMMNKWKAGDMHHGEGMNMKGHEGMDMKGHEGMGDDKR